MPSGAHQYSDPRPGPGPCHRPGAFVGVLLTLAVAVVHLACVDAQVQDYQVPSATFEAFYPRGLRVSIPDEDGVQLFAFHGSVNRDLDGVEAGEMSVDITRKTNGRWVYLNAQKRLKVGDVINYWLYVQRDGRGFQRLGLSHEITELIGEDPLPTPTVQRPEDRPTQSGVSDLEYRPPPPTYETRPPPYESRPPTGHAGGNRPPPYENRPPPYENHPPPYENHPLPYESRPPPYENRPPPSEQSRPPPYESRPSHYESRPPPPPTGDYRPPSNHYGSRPPPPPTHNFEYPPPPAPDQAGIGSPNHHVGSAAPNNQAVIVSHNHHVGYANHSEDHHPTNNFNPPSTTTTDNFNTGDRYSTNNNNFNSGDRYPTNNNNFNSGDRYPTSRPQPQQQQNAVYQPKPSVTVGSSTGDRPNVSVGTSTDVDFNPTLGALSPTQGTWGQQGAGPAGAQGPGLPLNGDRFTVTPTSPSNCELSVTHVNGQPACKGQVVFEEDWKSIDPRRWSHEVKISGSPDYEFCIYAQHSENTFTQNGRLHLKPTLTNDKYGSDFVRKGKLQLDGCTGGAINSDSCSREAMFSYILPPVVASRITTKNNFSFKYGKIEVRARLPRGDWLYPELWLQPLREEYGPGLASGRIHLAMARGNRQLRGPAPDADDLSGRTLVVGALAGARNTGSAGALRKFFTRRHDRGLWTEQFHNYTLLWTPETLAFSVDGVEIGVARPEELGGLLHGRAGADNDPWAQGSRIAPFDKEFYISLGMAAGGIHAFPDGCKSGNHDKPWKNTGAKAMLSFWNARDVWYSTWNGQSDLQVESIRVEALNN